MQNIDMLQWWDERFFWLTLLTLNHEVQERRCMLIL